MPNRYPSLDTYGLDLTRILCQLKTEQDILDELGTHLHTYIQTDSPDSKTTIRILDAGTGELKHVFHAGIPRDPNSNFTGNINENSIYAAVVREAKLKTCGNIAGEENPQFIATVPGIHSHLTVPLLVANDFPYKTIKTKASIRDKEQNRLLCLGAVNLESRQANYYTEEHQHYVSRITSIAAEMILRIRARIFGRELLDLLDDFINRDKILFPNHKSYRTLYKFINFKQLIYLKPDPRDPHNPKFPWNVEAVIHPDGREGDRDEIEKWRNHITTVWEHSFIRWNLLRDKDEPLHHTDTNFADDEAVGIITRSQTVLRIYPNENAIDPVAILSFHFPVREAITDYQHEWLIHFGKFVGKLIESGAGFNKTREELQLVRNIARIGEAFVQFRHALITQVGIIGNAVAFLRDETTRDSQIDNIQKALDMVLENINKHQFLAREPIFEEVEVSTVWEDVRTELGDKNISIDNGIQPCNNRVSCITDRKRLQAILFNLALNSCQNGKECPDFCVALVSEEHEEQIYLYVRDTGPGLAQNMRSKLFEPGLSQRSDGTGYGLYFSKRFAEDIGATLEYDDAWTKGASFLLKLPKNNNAF